MEHADRERTGQGDKGKDYDLGTVLGRGAVIRPWLFAEIAGSVFGSDITARVVSLPDVYAAFIDALNADYRPIYHLGRLKTFTHYFARNYKFGHSLATKVQASGSMDEAIEKAGAFFAKNSQESMAATGAGVGDRETVHAASGVI